MHGVPDACATHLCVLSSQAIAPQQSTAAVHAPPAGPQHCVKSRAPRNEQISVAPQQGTALVQSSLTAVHWAVLPSTARIIDRSREAEEGELRSGFADGAGEAVQAMAPTAQAKSRIRAFIGAPAGRLS